MTFEDNVYHSFQLIGEYLTLKCQFYKQLIDCCDILPIDLAVSLTEGNAS